MSENKKATNKNRISAEMKQSDASNNQKDSYFLENDDILETSDPKEYIDEP